MEDKNFAKATTELYELIECYARISEKMYELIGSVRTKLEYLERHIDENRDINEAVINDIKMLQNDLSELINMHKNIDISYILRKAEDIVNYQEKIYDKIEDISETIAHKQDIKEVYNNLINKFQGDIINSIKTGLSNEKNLDKDMVKAVYATIRTEEEIERQKHRRWWYSKWFYLFGVVLPVLITSLTNIWGLFIQRPIDKIEKKEDILMLKNDMDRSINSLNLRIRDLENLILNNIVTNK